MKKVKVEDAVGMTLCHDITAIDDHFKGAAFHRGQVITQEDVEKLKNIGKNHIFIWEENAGEIHEEDAAIRLSKLCQVEGGVYSGPSEGKMVQKAGVKRVNVSLDTMNPEKYRSITGGGDIQRALRGIEAARKVGMTPIKINTVLMGGFNDGEIPEFVEMTREHPIELRFIELMPMGPGAEFGEGAYLPGQTVLDRVPELRPLPEDGGVARLYQLPGAAGRVGLISPLSRHFCGTCNRLRLTSEGALKPCLHSSQEIPLRGLHGDALREAMVSAILAKPKMHGALDAHHRSQAGRNMNTIGG